MSGPIIGLTMIARNESATITPCLDSVLPHVDRAVIVDTGSTDDTRHLIRQAFLRHAGSLHPDTMRLETADWPDDFAAARQDALERMLRAYPEITHIFWCDADDVVSGAAGLHDLAAQLDAMRQGDQPVGGLLTHYAYAHDQHGNLSCSHFRERLVRVEAIDRWHGKIHEVLGLKPGWGLAPAAAPERSTLAKGGPGSWPLAPGGLEIIHNRPASKNDSTEGRNRAILEAELAEVEAAGRTPDGRTLFYLSQEYAIEAAVGFDRLREKGQDDATAYRDKWLVRAIDMLERYDGVSEWDQERYQARHRRADFLRALGRQRDALAVDLSAIELLPEWPDSWHGAAESYLALGNARAALTYADAGLTKVYPQTMLILNPLDYTVIAWDVRARALHALGRTEEALAQVREALAVSPGDQGLLHNEAAWAEQVNRARIKDALLALDEALARHDENLKAAAVLESAPYFLADDPEVAERRKRRRAGVRHVMQDAVYDRYYGDDNPVHPIAESIGFLPGELPEQIDAFCANLPRAQFLLRGLREQAGGDDLSGLSLLDLGCNDGWLGLWLVGTCGLGRYVGMDLSAEALRVARGYRAEHYQDVADRIDYREQRVDQLVPEDEVFDAVVSFEVIEHVPDPALLIATAASACRAEGRVYLSTPNGAYERGHVSDWNDDSPRGHVRALRTRDMVGLALDQGALEAVEETTDRLICVAMTPGYRKGTADFYLGPSAGTWSPLDGLDRGLGGSETMAVRMAGQLAARGWRVRVFGHCEQASVAQVEYLPWYLFDPTERRDVLIGSRCPHLIRDEPSARHRVLWLHDADYPDLEELAPRWDEVWLVGHWQRDTLPLGDARTWVTRNAIPLDRFADGTATFDEREPALVYSSCPSRGLVTLLGLWPEIREKAAMRGLQEPQLHICYGFTDLWKAHERMDPSRRELREYVESQVNAPGVVWHGGVGQVALSKLQQRSRVWAYPTDFPEVSCITAMEAQAAGMAIITSEHAELPYTVDSAGELLPVPSRWDERDRERFVSQVVTWLTSQHMWESAHERALRGAGRFDVEALGDQWDERLSAAIDLSPSPAVAAMV